MPGTINIFRSSTLASQFHQAYAAVVQQWTVPYEDLHIPTRFGDTHIIASGPKDAPPIVLLPPGGTYAPIWIRNVGPLSQSFRTYAVDIIGEMSESVPTRPILSQSEFMQWMADLFDGQAVIRRAARLLPYLKAEIIPNANHIAQYTAPDAVNAKILGFLAA